MARRLAGRSPILRRPPAGLRLRGRHGVTAKGVSAFPSDVNRQMLENFAAGGAAINQICAAYGLGFKVFDLAIDMPTGDITETDAMDEKACVATMAFGMEAIAGGTDLLAIGEMGIGNTTVAAAIYTSPLRRAGRALGRARHGHRRRRAGARSRR